MTTATPTAPAPEQPKNKRGREGALDMVRSLALCMLLVIPIWYLAQPPKDAEQTLRVVDQGPEISAWQAGVPSAPAPRGVPEEWQATVAQGVRSPTGLRLGWNTDRGSYIEFAASTGPRGPFVSELTGEGRAQGSVDVDGTPWERFVDDDGSVSLVRSGPTATVVVGTLRSTATDDELLELARSVRP